MAPLQVLLPACALRAAPDEVPLPEYSTASGMCDQRLWKRRKSMPATCSQGSGLLNDNDMMFSKVRFDTSFECNEFSEEDDADCAKTLALSFLPFKSPSAAYFDGCDDGFGLTPVADGYNCNDYNGQPLWSFCLHESVQESAVPIASSIACATNSTALPDSANASRKRLSRTIQYSFDTLTSKCEEPSPYVIQASENESRMFMAGKMWEFSQDVQGCREVQKALEDCKSSQDFHSVAVQLTGHVWEAMRCPHANHVLRKVVQTMPASSLDFIIQEIVQEGTADVKLFVSHRYGCRIVEELLRICRPEQLHGMMEHLLVEADGLCTHMYGNFVMKAFLQHASHVQRQKLVQTLRDNIVTMGTNFYACAVLTEVLKINNELARSLACVLVNTLGLLSAMASHKHGKTVVEAVLFTLGGVEHQAAVNALALPPLKVAKAPKAAKNPRA